MISYRLSLFRLYRNFYKHGDINPSSMYKSIIKCFCTVQPFVTPADDASSERYHAFLKSQKISRAMEVYLKKTREKEELLHKENAEFELGKRHLANMMGLDPDIMTQDDIDEAIKYLLPSGLFSTKARPTMKPPSYYYPPIKSAEFAKDGRPFDDMFYTNWPRFYQHLYNVYEKIELLDKHADKVRLDENASAVTDPDNPETQLVFVGTTWKNKESLEKLFVERLKDEHVTQFVVAMEHLSAHPFAYMENEFIMQLRDPTVHTSVDADERKFTTKTDENNRVYTEAEARRKSCNAIVKLYPNGTGKFAINDSDLLNLLPASRETILFPFMILDRYDEFDVVAVTEGGGESSRAGAIRLGICKALCPHLNEREIEKLKVAGLLTRDPRRKERNHFHHRGARAGLTWKRR